MKNNRVALLVLVSLILFDLFATTVVISAQASSANVKAIVDDKIALEITFTFENTTLFEEIKANPNFNVSTIPKALRTRLEEGGSTDVKTEYDPNQQLFDDAQKSIKASFKIGGESIQKMSIDRSTMKKMYTLRMHWRNFAFNFTDTVSVDFAEFFSQPVPNWGNSTTPEGRVMFNYSNNQADAVFSQADISLALPVSAKNIRFSEEGEKIFYEMPMPFEDNFINSPLLILTIVLIVVFVAYAYREIVKIVR